MKQSILLFFILICTFASAQFNYFPFPPTMNDFKLNEQAGVKIAYEYQLFGEEKTLLQTIEYGNMGFPAAKYENGFDENGDSAILAEYDYTYKSNQLSLIRCSNVDVEPYLIEFTYNKKGNLLKKSVLEFDVYSYEYIYEKGQIIGATIYRKAVDENGKIFSYANGNIKFRYNEKGQLNTEAYYDSDNNLIYMNQWLYNEKGQITCFYRLNDLEQEVSKEQYEYNENQLISRKTVESIGEDPSEYIYDYCTDCVQSWMKAVK